VGFKINTKGAKLHWGPKPQDPAEGAPEPRRKTREVVPGIVHRSHPIRNRPAPEPPRIRLSDLPSIRTARATPPVPVQDRPGFTERLEIIEDISLTTTLEQLADHPFQDLSFERPSGDIPDHLVPPASLPPSEAEQVPGTPGRDAPGSPAASLRPSEAEQTTGDAPRLSEQMLGLRTDKDRYRFAKGLTEPQRTALEQHALHAAMDPQAPMAARVQHLHGYLTLQHARLSIKLEADKAAHDTQPLLRRALASAGERHRYNTESRRPEYGQAIRNLTEAGRQVRQLAIDGGPGEIPTPMGQALDARLAEMAHLINPKHLASIRSGKMAYPREMFTEIARHVVNASPPLEAAIDLARLEAVSQDAYLAAQGVRLKEDPELSRQASDAALTHDSSAAGVADVVRKFHHISVPPRLDLKRIAHILHGLGKASAADLAKTKSIEFDLSQALPLGREEGKNKADDHCFRELLSAFRHLNRRGPPDLSLSLDIDLGHVDRADRDARFITELLTQEGSRLKRLALNSRQASPAVAEAVRLAVESIHCTLVELDYRLTDSARTYTAILEKARTEGNTLERLYLQAGHALPCAEVEATLDNPSNRLTDLFFRSDNMTDQEAATLARGLKSVHAARLEKLHLRLPFALDGTALGQKMIEALLHVHATGDEQMDNAANAGGVKDLVLDDIRNVTGFDNLMLALASGMNEHLADFPLRSLAIHLDAAFQAVITPFCVDHLIMMAARTRMETLDIRPIDLSREGWRLIGHTVRQHELSGAMPRILHGPFPT
jgi:hypothetical protein